MTIPRSIEAMAAERLPLILEAQPEGPYRLCGYCIGGIVAFETARLLVAAGKDVEMVFMIDPPTHQRPHPSRCFLRRIGCFFRSSSVRGRILGAAVDRAMAWTWYRSTDFQKFCDVSGRQAMGCDKEKMRRLMPAIRLLHRVASRLDTTRVLRYRRSEVRRRSEAGYAAAMSNYRPEASRGRVV